MQYFRVNPGEAQKLHERLFHNVDDAWGTLVEGERHPISDGYALLKHANRLSLYRTLRALNGRDYQAILGEDCTLDVVRITEWEPDTCKGNCRVSFLWRKDTEEDGRAHYPHRSFKRCGHHGHLDDAQHCHELWGENGHKNITLEEVAAEVGVHPAEIGWSFDKDRVLLLKHPLFANGQNKGRAAMRANANPVSAKRAFRLLHD